jgi:hypothetical protein
MLVTSSLTIALLSSTWVEVAAAEEVVAAVVAVLEEGVVVVLVASLDGDSGGGGRNLRKRVRISEAWRRGAPFPKVSDHLEVAHVHRVVDTSAP